MSKIPSYSELTTLRGDEDLYGVSYETDGNGISHKIKSGKLMGAGNRNLVRNPAFLNISKANVVIAASTSAKIDPFWRVDNGTNQSCTVTLGTDGGIPGLRCLRVNFAVAPTTGDVNVYQDFPMDVAMLAGRKASVAFSFESTNAATVGAALKQDFGVGGSADTYTQFISGTAYTANSGYQRYTGTSTVPSIAGKSFDWNLNNFVLEIDITPRATGDYNLTMLQLQDGPISDFHISPRSVDLPAMFPASPGDRNLLSNLFATRSGGASATINASTGWQTDGYYIWNGTNQTVTLSLVDGPRPATKAWQFAFSVAPTTGNIGIMSWGKRGGDWLNTLEGRAASAACFFKSSNTCTINESIYQDFGTGGSASVTTTFYDETHTGSGDWVRHAGTIQVPTIVGKTIGTQTQFSFSVNFYPRNTGNFLISCFSLEEGPLSVFQTRRRALDRHYTWDIAEQVTLFEDTTFYVRTDGSDNNDGLSDSAAGAWQNINHAMWRMAFVDAAANGVTIQVQDGTYNPALAGGKGVMQLLYRPANARWFKIIGNKTTPANVLLRANCSAGWGYVVMTSEDDTAANPFRPIVVDELAGFKVDNGNGSDWVAGIRADRRSIIQNLNSITFGANLQSGIILGQHVVCNLNGNTRFENNVVDSLISVNEWAYMAVLGDINIVNAITANRLFWCGGAGQISVGSTASFTNPSNLTGFKYSVSNFGRLATGGKTLPGTGTAVNRAIVDDVWTA